MNHLDGLDCVGGRVRTEVFHALMVVANPDTVSSSVSQWSRARFEFNRIHFFAIVIFYLVWCAVLHLSDVNNR
jgi:hypothetical protein